MGPTVYLFFPFLYRSVLNDKQGGQLRGQHDGVQGFYEPVKSFTTFVILSQIPCGKVHKNPHIFLQKTVMCQSVSWVCCSFQDYVEQVKKKRKILRDWVHTLVVRGNLENCSEPGRNFTQCCAEIYKVILHITA